MLYNFSNEEFKRHVDFRFLRNYFNVTPDFTVDLPTRLAKHQPRHLPPTRQKRSRSDYITNGDMAFYDPPEARSRPRCPILVHCAQKNCSNFSLFTRAIACDSTVGCLCLRLHLLHQNLTFYFCDTIC